MDGKWNPAGTMDRVLELEPDQVETVYRANVVHQLLLVQRVMPAMVERGSGTIINVVSAAGMSDPQQPPESGGWGFAYSSSKAALIRMIGCLLAEHRDAGVRFFNLEPGLILTECPDSTRPHPRPWRTLNQAA